MRKEIVVKIIETLKNTRNEFSFFEFNECLKKSVELTENEKSEIFEAFTNFILRYFETNAMYGLDAEGNHVVTRKKVFVKTSFKTDDNLYPQISGNAANKEISELIKEARKNGFNKKTDFIMYVCNYDFLTCFLEEKFKKAIRENNGEWEHNPYILILDEKTIVKMIDWGNIFFWKKLTEFFKN